MNLHIVQLTDTHIAEDKPQRLRDLDNCVDAINALETPPSVVIHTGDISHNGLAEEYHNARHRLERLNAPCFVMAGNRDARDVLLDCFADDRYRLPGNGWLQYAIEDYPVRLLMVDTVCDHSNKGELCAQRLAHLDAMLAADTRKPVALFLHHPPYEAVGIPDPWQYENWEDVTRLESLLQRYDNIVGMYCGHVHRFIDGAIAGIDASAITCLAGDLRKGEVTDEERSQPVYKVVSFPQPAAQRR